MRFGNNLKNLSYRKISLQDGILLGFCLLLVCPFFILSYFNSPSVDDYSLVYNVSTFGFWQAQLTAYLNLTGRYSALFILCAHPLLTGSFALYNWVSVLLLFLTIHALYKFINFIFPFVGKINNLLLAFIFSFCFLNGMPTLVQGIYWMPGAITCHLANILTLYLTVNILTAFSNNFSSDSKLRKLKNYLLIFIICGLSETSMLVADVLLIFFFLFDVLSNRRIKTELIIYILLAVICSIIVFIAPGNAVREASLHDPHNHHLLFTITSSFEAGYKYILEWISSTTLIISSSIILLYYLIIPQNNTIEIKNIILFFLIIIGGFLLIVASFFPGFWSMSSVPPDRTVNIPYWVFLCTWLSGLISLLNFVSPYFKTIQNPKYRPVIFAPILALFFNLDSSDNYNIAVKDISSGKAYHYDKENLERDKIMRESKIFDCVVPSYSVFPKSIFNEDLSTDPLDWWNVLYADYYKKSSVRTSFKEPTYADNYFINFENETNGMLNNEASITNEFAFSPPNSSVLPVQDSYSSGFSRDMKDLKIDNIHDITTVHISTFLYPIDSVVNSTIVFCIADSTGKKVLFWSGKEIVSTNYLKNKWTKEEAFIPIKDEFISPGNRIFAYVWNKGKTKIFIDNMEVSIYY